MTEVTFDAWKKLDLCIGEILSVEDHPNADKLYVIKVDLGKETPTTIVSGLVGHYEKDDLVGRKIVVFTNLQPATLRGVESNGMLLAAEENGKVVLLGPEQDIANGSNVS